MTFIIDHLDSPDSPLYSAFPAV
jgi:hypothetical protein